jgi:hypothetical protein
VFSSRIGKVACLTLLGALAAWPLGAADAQVQGTNADKNFTALSRRYLARLKLKIAVSPNQRVVDFARSKLGQQVGNGECWTLAYQALDAAGAKRPGQDGLTVYQFGDVVALGQLKPGDVLQFENVNFKHTNANGSWYSSSYPHHTAIVAAVAGTRITLLNQNVGGNRTVQETTIDLNDRLPGGSITAFVPVAR